MQYYENLYMTAKKFQNKGENVSSRAFSFLKIGDFCLSMLYPMCLRRMQKMYQKNEQFQIVLVRMRTLTHKKGIQLS
jgi:hypothetical protein